MANFYYVNIIETIWLYYGDDHINLKVTVGIKNYLNILIATYKSIRNV